MAKKIYITEEQEQMLVKHLVMETRYPINPAHVLYVKDILDKNFIKCTLNQMSPDGNPVSTPIVQLKGPDGNPVRGCDAIYVQDFLEPKCAHMFADRIQLPKFLRQVIIDWYDNKITKEGLLSVTHC